MERNIVESNKMIAEFMEAEFFIGLDFNNKSCEVARFPFGNGNWHNSPVDSLTYNEDWNELMPVVVKISQYKFKDYEDYRDMAYMRTFGMIDENGQFMAWINRFGICYGDTLIDATYKAVIAFLHWYKTK